LLRHFADCRLFQINNTMRFLSWKKEAHLSRDIT
jgi:hypothetical protein